MLGWNGDQAFNAERRPAIKKQLVHALRMFRPNGSREVPAPQDGGLSVSESSLGSIWTASYIRVGRGS